MKINEFILQLGDVVEKLIAEYETFKYLKGKQRKDRVIELLNQWIDEALKKLTINAVLKAIIKFILPKILPEIVQVAFNLIETNIKGITK